MKSSRVIILVMLISAFVLAGVSNSEAACPIVGKIVYTYTTGAYGYVYVASSYFPTYYYYFYTSDPVILARIGDIHAGNLKCYISGNVTSCPTSGTYRYGGVIERIYSYTLY